MWVKGSCAFSGKLFWKKESNLRWFLFISQPRLTRCAKIWNLEFDSGSSVTQLIGTILLDLDLQEMILRNSLIPPALNALPIDRSDHSPSLLDVSPVSFWLWTSDYRLGFMWGKRHLEFDFSHLLRRVCVSFTPWYHYGLVVDSEDAGGASGFWCFKVLLSDLMGHKPY